MSTTPAEIPLSKRKIWSIPGGVHPPENKRQSLNDVIGTLPMPDILVLPLNQHIGAPAKSVVEVGERVLKGQLVAEAAGFVSANIHAPTSGHIESIQDHQVPHPSGMTTTCILIKPDGKDEWAPHEGISNYLEADPKTLLDAVRGAGITGMGGAGFPSSVKLSPRQTIDILIINGTECEPYITADDILMQERADRIVDGVKILARILGNPKTVLIGIEDNKPTAFEKIAEAAADTAFEVVEFPTKYPSGGEKQLIQILTGKEVPSGKLPADLGIVCHNVGTAEAIYRAVALGEPLIRRVTTVTGKACGTNRNYEVLLGTPVSHLLEHNAFDKKRCTRLVMGGPMMGFTLPDSSVPVNKSTNCILACDKSEAPGYAPQQPCIRCGMCAEACPASLLPQQLYWYSQSQDTDKLRAYNLFDCIECGACAYVCPSNIPLVQYYRAAKGEIRQQDADKRKSDHARQRFEFHQARLERAEAEKAAKREARKKAAEAAQSKVAAEPSAATGSADDLIKAAMAKAEARKASPEQQKAKLERGIESARNRLQFTEEKLTSAESEGLSPEQIEKLRVNVEEAQRKLAEAEKKLADFKPDSDVATAIKNKIEASPRDQLEAKIKSLQERIATTEAKIAGEQDEKVADALKNGLEKQRQKLADAEAQLANLGEGGTAPVEDAPAMDAAAAAIARAQAKAEAAAAMTPAEKLAANIEALTQRIEKSKTKLDSARADGADHADALAAGLEKLEAKLAEALSEKAQLEAESVPAPAQEQDAAAAAIARAQAKAEAMAAMTPQQKLDAAIASLEDRITKARTKLDKAKAEGADHIDALEAGMEKLEAKLESAQQDRAALETQS